MTINGFALVIACGFSALCFWLGYSAGWAAYRQFLNRAVKANFIAVYRHRAS